jgi:L-asparaginase
MRSMPASPDSRSASRAATVVILGTGGTIAGTAASADDNIGYTAAQLGVAQLVAAVPALAAERIEAHQVAQLDSKDMDHDTWRALAHRVHAALARPEVAGVVITHGTDTLEETAYFLQRVLAPSKPVVLTAAMRPASALMADGPVNLLDAVFVARTPGARGVVAVVAGTVHSAFDVRKRHTYRLDAFDSGDAGAIAQVEEGAVRQHRAWPEGVAAGLNVLPAEGAAWPRVEWITSHAGAAGAIVRVLVADGVHGLVVAGTGNGTLHRDLEAALREAVDQGVAVLRCTRCAEGVVLGQPQGRLPSAGALSPAQARIELMLQLMQVRE